MSERTNILDEAGQPFSRRENRDVVEPLIQYMKDRPVSAGLVILAIGFVLGKIL